MHGEFLQAVQALYACVPMCVKLSHGLSDTFASELGLKQGCPLSPLLFGIFVDDFQCVLERGSADCALPSLSGSHVPALFYADDLALVSETEAGLQAQLRLLEQYSARWGLTVNVAKTKAVVYTTSRYPVTPPSLCFLSRPIEVVDEFTYLGVQLHGTQQFSFAGAARAQSARRAMLALQHRCADLRLSDPVLLLRLFDALVLPVLLYGAEAWGPGALLCKDEELRGCERVHRAFLRALLGVRAGTPNAVVLGETARYPVAMAAAKLLVRFWNRLVAMDDGRLTKQAFMESVRLATCARPKGWAHQVVSFLTDVGVPPVVDGVPVRIDLDVLRVVLQRRYLDSVDASDLVKVQSWRRIVGPLCAEGYTLPVYLQQVVSRVRRRRLAQFRTGSHWLRVEAGRWSQPPLPREERLCQRCSCGVVDDEAHMVWECPALVDTRLHHMDLFRHGASTLSDFLQQDPGCVGSFLQQCYRVCGDLEGWSAR